VPAPAPAPSPAAFSPFTTTVASGLQVAPGAGPGTLTDAAGPQVARLAGGGSAVAWISGHTLMAQVLDASGQRVGDATAIAGLFTQAPQWPFAVGALAGGGFVVAWLDETHPELDMTQFGTPYTLQFARLGPQGELLQGSTQIGGLLGRFDPWLQVVGRADGGFVIASSTASMAVIQPLDAGAVFFDAQGQPTGQGLTVSQAGDDTQLNLVALADGSWLAAWVGLVEGASGSVVRFRHLAADGTPLDAAPVAVPASAQAGALQLRAVLLADGDVALAWKSLLNGTTTLGWQQVQAGGSLLGTPGSLVEQRQVSGLALAPQAGPGFSLFYGVLNASNRGESAQVVDLTLDGQGALLAQGTLASRLLWTVSPTTGATTGPSGGSFGLGAGADGHFVLATEAGISGGAELDALGQ